MTCQHCGSCRHLLHHDLDRARLVCRSCGHQGAWMDPAEWRALVEAAVAVMRGAATLLAEQSSEQAAA